MKRFAIFAVTAAIATAGSAWADTSISVLTPKDPTSKEQAAAYIADLDQAVRRVCAKTNSPIVGVNFYTYQACVKQTRIATAQKDPTGLYKLRESVSGT